MCIYTLLKLRYVDSYLYWYSLQRIELPVAVWPSFVLICPDPVSKDQLDQQRTRCHISTAGSLAQGIRHWMLGCRQQSLAGGRHGLKMQHLRHKVNSTGHSCYIESFMLLLLSDLKTQTHQAGCSKNTGLKNVQNPQHLSICRSWVFQTSYNSSFSLYLMSFSATSGTNHVLTRGSEQGMSLFTEKTPANVPKAN